MSRSPTLEEITVVLAQLAKRLTSDPGPGVDPILLLSLGRALDELKAHIPGLETPPDAEQATALGEAAREALARGKWLLALARALRGLSFSPHDPELHFVAGMACFELGAATEAIALLQHALWINPAHPEARRDLEALSAFCEPGTTLVPGDSEYPPGTSFDLLEGEWETIDAGELDIDPSHGQHAESWPPESWVSGSEPHADPSAWDDELEDLDETA